MNAPSQGSALAHNVRRLGHLDIPGGGQVVVQGHHAFLGHMKPPYGTTILDISDPRKPRVVTEIKLETDRSHTHKVRVAGDIMVTNVEHNNRRVVRASQRMLKARAELELALGRKPSRQEVAAKLGLAEAELAPLEAELASGYAEGGFKVWDIANPAKPRLIVHQKTGGVGVHRFDMDERYAYISTEMEGYLGNILVIYDLHDPQHPAEVSRWWMPGQHVAGGEKPTWPGMDYRLHHTLRQGDKLWAGCWLGGLRVIDVADIAKPRTVGAYNYHPPIIEPTHTVFKVPFAVAGREIALVTDEEHEHHRGQPHAGMWVFDVTDLAHIHPIGQFHVSEMDSPWSRTPGGRFGSPAEGGAGSVGLPMDATPESGECAPSTAGDARLHGRIPTNGAPAPRFGAHQFQEHMSDTRVFCTWFGGGLRVIDIRNPLLPEEVGYFIPEPCGGFTCPQSNDVDVDQRGLIYMLDRNCGFDVLEFQS